MQSGRQSYDLRVAIVGGLLGALALLALFLQHVAIINERTEQARLSEQQNSSPAPDSEPVLRDGEQGSRERMELERLRAEVARLRAQIAEARSRLRAQTNANLSSSQISATNPPLSVIRYVDARDAGQATAPALVETLIWAVSHGDTNRMFQLMSFNPGADLDKLTRQMGDVRAEFERAAGSTGILTNGPSEVRILGEQMTDNNDRWLVTSETHSDGRIGRPERVRIRWTDTGWRLVIGTNGEPVHENIDSQP